MASSKVRIALYLKYPKLGTKHLTRTSFQGLDVYSGAIPMLQSLTFCGAYIF